MGDSSFLTAWLALLNRTSHDESLLSPEIVLEAYPQGRGGEPLILRGRAEVMAWVRRGKPGLYRFSAEQCVAGQADPDLPMGAQAFRSRYRVELADPNHVWSNEGDWCFHVTGSQIVALRHTPERLAADSSVKSTQRST